MLSTMLHCIQTQKQQTNTYKYVEIMKSPVCGLIQTNDLPYFREAAENTWLGVERHTHIYIYSDHIRK